MLLVNALELGKISGPNSTIYIYVYNDFRKLINRKKKNHKNSRKAWSAELIAGNPL